MPVIGQPILPSFTEFSTSFWNGSDWSPRLDTQFYRVLPSFFSRSQTLGSRLGTARNNADRYRVLPSFRSRTLLLFFLLFGDVVSVDGIIFNDDARSVQPWRNASRRSAGYFPSLFLFFSFSPFLSSPLDFFLSLFFVFFFYFLSFFGRARGGGVASGADRGKKKSGKK